MRVSAEVPLIKVGDYQLIEKRFAAASVALGDHIYTIGGGKGDFLINSIERFNVRTAKSEIFAHLKQGRRWHRAVVVGQAIYVLGGYTSVNELRGPTASIEIIDTATGRVSTGPNLPKGRALFACALIDRKIHVIGGVILKGNYLERGLSAEDGGSIEVQKQTMIFARTNSTAIFDLASQRWSEGMPMPNPCEAVGTIVAGPFIVIAGGLNLPAHHDDRGNYVEAEALDQVVSFNPRDGQWRIQAPLHRPASAHSLAFLGHYLFLFGGRDAEDELIAYDLKARQSESFTLGYKGARHTAAVVHEDKIYVVGGKDRTDAVVDFIQIFKLRKTK